MSWTRWFTVLLNKRCYHNRSNAWEVLSQKSNIQIFILSGQILPSWCSCPAADTLPGPSVPWLQPLPPGLPSPFWLLPLVLHHQGAADCLAATLTAAGRPGRRAATWPRTPVLPATPAPRLQIGTHIDISWLFGGPRCLLLHCRSSCPPLPTPLLYPTWIVSLFFSAYIVSSNNMYSSRVILKWSVKHNEVWPCSQVVLHANVISKQLLFSL